MHSYQYINLQDMEACCLKQKLVHSDSLKTSNFYSSSVKDRSSLKKFTHNEENIHLSTKFPQEGMQVSIFNCSKTVTVKTC